MASDRRPAALDAGRGRPRHGAARRPRADPARQHRRADRPGPRQARRVAVHRRLRARRRLLRDQRLRELSKMDGASSSPATSARSCAPGVQLVPDPNIATEETGTRHRTAERVAKQTGFPVISVSQSMRIIALYVDGRRYVLDDSASDPVPRQPGAGDPRALQAPPRRGRRHPVGARDRGPGHGPRRDGGQPAPGDGAPDRDRDRGLRRRARHRRPAAVAAARGADGRRRGRARAGRARLPRLRQRPPARASSRTR